MAESKGVQVTFTSRDNGPSGSDGPLAGAKFVGFNLWKGADGEVYVTFPSRAFGAAASAITSTT